MLQQSEQCREFRGSWSQGLLALSCTCAAMVNSAFNFSLMGAVLIFSFTFWVVFCFSSNVLAAAVCAVAQNVHWFRGETNTCN